MEPNIEGLLDQSGLRYTKEVVPGEADSFSVSFETPEGIVSLRVFAAGGMLGVWSLIRSLDSLPLGTPRKDLLVGLLRLNDGAILARVSVWTSEKDEVDWIVVAGQLPPGVVNADLLRGLVIETAQCASDVLRLIALHTTAGQQSSLRAP